MLWCYFLWLCFNYFLPVTFSLCNTNFCSVTSTCDYFHPPPYEGTMWTGVVQGRPAWSSTWGHCYCQVYTVWDLSLMIRIRHNSVILPYLAMVEACCLACPDCLLVETVKYNRCWRHDRCWDIISGVTCVGGMLSCCQPCHSQVLEEVPRHFGNRTFW